MCVLYTHTHIAGMIKDEPPHVQFDFRTRNND